MAAPGPIDPRLQYAPPAPQQYPPSVDALRRVAQQSHAHAHADLTTNPPRQPYYIPHQPHRPTAPPPHAHEPLDPALEEAESPLHDSDVHPSPDDASGLTKTPDAKRGRACDSCRGLKVKCDFGDNHHPGEPCKRCAKAKRPCIVTPATRRRQKKADSRVAELERKVDALTQRLAEQGGVHVDDGLKRAAADSSSPYQITTSQYHADQRLLGSSEELHSPEKRRRLDPALTRGADSPDERQGASSAAPSVDSQPSNANAITGIYNETKPMVFDHSDIDQRISSIVDVATAERLFDRYMNQFVPRFPAVTFSPATKAKHIRKTKPILFLAILSSTCFGSSVPPKIQEKLEEELRDVLADSMWKKGEKSLEIIQSLQVATLWYRPPSNFEQHMFYQMVHASAFMAIDIGIGKRMAPSKRKLFDRSWRRPGVPNPESAEVRRAWLTSYFLCTSISMILRRPILFPYTDYMRECLEYLESADDALASDKILCQHVRLAYIAENIAVQFALDDPAVNLSMSDGTVSYGIKHFEKDLSEVIEKHVSDHAIKLSEHVTSLYLHEIALHSQNNVEDFKTPFTEESFKASPSQPVLGPHHVDALTACMSACRNILDTFLAYDRDSIYILPIIFSVRCIYAVVVLIKLYIAAKSPGEMSNIINTDELGVGTYIDQLHQLFKSFMERDSKSPHSKFLYVMERLHVRFTELQRGEIEGANGRKKSTGATAMHGSTTVKPSGPAQGLHLLSEAAMSGNQPGGPPAQQQHQGQGQPPQGWYPQPSEMQPTAHSLPIDPSYSQYPPEAMAGFDGVGYGLGGLGMASMGMDGAISGLFMADGLWNFNQPHGQVYPGWS